MKELLIEEKAKRYDKAIERAKGAHNSAKSDKENGVTDKITEYTIQLTETIFPELKESEDERIRKSLINYVHCHGDAGDFTKKEFIAWLEKQDKKIDAIENFDTEFEKQISRLIASIINKDYKYTKDFVKWTSNALLNYAKYEIEKQGEQKPLVIPKFREGDIIKRKDTGETFEVSKIEAIYADEIYYHLTNGGCVCENSDNFERVEKKSVTDLRTWKYIVDAVLTEKEGIGQYLDSPFTEEVAKKLQKRFGNIEQKSAWSEEDETMVEDIIEAIDTQYAVTDYNEMVNWFKSLKDRVQPQNCYNPYKEVVESIAEMCKHYDVASHSGLRDFYNNVKVKCKDAKEYDSLFPQNTWKPSDEQIKACKEVYADILSAKGFDLDTVNSELNRMEKQLKKLREE